MKKLALLLLGAGSLISAPALAADLPVKAVYKAVTVYNWTGFYAGAHAGYGWSRGNVDNFYLPSTTFFGVTPNSQQTNPKGFLGGGQVGFNLQNGRFVYGIEADLAFASIRGDSTQCVVSDLGVPFLCPGTEQQDHFRMRSFGTVRGRAGMTVSDRGLLYVTGGFAFARIEYSAGTVGFNPNFPGSATTTKTGWTIGAGSEWAIADRWTVKAEYLYYDLGRFTLIADGNPPLPPDQIGSTFETKGHIVRAGLNYRFDWGGPVVARY